MRKILILPVIAMLITILSFLPQDAHATTFTGTQSGNWDDPATWGGASPPITIGSGDEVIIPEGITVTIPSSVTVTNLGVISTSGDGKFINEGTIDNSGTIVNGNEGLCIICGISMSNLGVINNSGTLTSCGCILTALEHPVTTSNSGTINNSGKIIIPGVDTFDNAGGIINNNAGGTITIKSIEDVGIRHGTLINSGTINNNIDSTITSISIIINSGTITNSGTINNNFLFQGGPFIGTIHNSGIITNSGTINEECGSVFTGNPVQGTAPIIPCPPPIPEFPIPFSMIIIFVAVAAVYMGIRQKMIPGFKTF